MARRCLVLTGPASSTGSPTTLMMRPSVSSPTGTEMGSPVSVTSWPRTSPSVVSIEMVRTVDSPRCCATSSTRRLPPFCVSSAFRIAGRSPSNCTSTTAPMTWVMRPGWIAMMSSSRNSVFLSWRMIPKSLSTFRDHALERLGPGDDLDQFLGDHRLAGAVIGQRLLAYHLAGIARGIVHRAHAGALLGGGVFQERAEYLRGDIARQQLRQDVFLVRLVFIGRARAAFGLLRDDGGDDLLRGRDLRDHRPETREEQGADVEFAGLEQRDDLVRDRLGIREAERAHRAQLDGLDDLLLVDAFELVVALAADAQDLDLLALAGQRDDALAREPHDRRIERAAQAALGGAHHQEMDVGSAGAGEQAGRRIAAGDGGRDVAQHLVHALRIGTRDLGGRLRAAQLGSRDHLHGLGDLLRRLGGGAAHPHVFEAGHF